MDHIIQGADGGSDEEDNGIPLCFDCHAEVHTYNDRHPRGTKFRPEELRQHRDRLFRWIEEAGPLVLDALAYQAVPILECALSREDLAPTFARVDLEHDARLARYLRYIRAAEEAQRGGYFDLAIRRFESAFVLAESDDAIEDYARSGNYYFRKILLWQCHLEASAHGGGREHLRAALNMGIDENAVREVHVREGFPGGLSGREYFYLLLQEKLFLFDDEIRKRTSPERRLERVAQFMDLIENPHCPDRDEALVKRARELEREIRETIGHFAAGLRYTRADI